MIGVQRGVTSNNLSFSNDDPFNYIYHYTPLRTGIEKDSKINEAEYFFAGEIEPDEEGRLLRNKESIKSKSLISIDYDDIGGVTEQEAKILIHRALKKYNYYLYPTFSAKATEPRFRLIIQPSREMKPEEYQIMVRKITDLIELPYDLSSESSSQLQGLPIINNNNKSIQPVKNNTGVAYPIPYYIKDDSHAQSDNSEIIKFKGNKTPLKHYDQDTVINAVKGYIDLNQDALQNYEESLIFIFRVAGAVQEGVIDTETAQESVKLLAMGNENWEVGNLQKLNREIGNPKLDNSISFVEMINLLGKGFEPQSMGDLIDLLSNKARRYKNCREDSRKKKSLDPYEVANILIDTVHFALIGDIEDKSPLYFYNLDKGIYENNETMIYKLIKAVENRHNMPQWKNVIGHLRTEAKLVKRLNDKNLIACNNGIYNLETDELIEFSPEFYIDSKISTNYNPDAKKPDYFDVDEWIRTIANNDDEVEVLLWQVMNEAINPNHTRNKIGFLIGDGANGKGTYQKLLIELIGQDNISALKPPEFGERFKTSNLLGKVCNIGDDISNKYIDDISDLMSIATGDTITIEEKNRPSYAVTLKTFCLFSGNSMPRGRNKSEGWYRRLLLIPMLANFKGQKEDTKIKDVYMEDRRVLEYVLKKVLKMKFKKFVIPKVIEDEISEYKKENDYMLSFIEDIFIGDDLYKRDPSTGEVKDRINLYLSNSGSRISLPYHWTKDFISKVNQYTGETFEVKAIKREGKSCKCIVKVTDGNR